MQKLVRSVLRTAVQQKFKVDAAVRFVKHTVSTFRTEERRRLCMTSYKVKITFHSMCTIQYYSSSGVRNSTMPKIIIPSYLLLGWGHNELYESTRGEERNIPEEPCTSGMHTINFRIED